MLSLTQVALTYGSGRRAEFASVMEPLDLELASGTVLGVVGPNGAGKTSCSTQLPELAESRVLDAWMAKRYLPELADT